VNPRRNSESRRPFDVFLVFGAWRSVGASQRLTAAGRSNSCFSSPSGEEKRATHRWAAQPARAVSCGRQVGSGVEWGKAAHTADQFFLPAQCTYVFTRISTPRGLWATTGLDLTTPSLKAQFCLLQLPTSAHGHLRSKRGWQKPSSENAQHQRGGSNLHMTKSFVSILLLKVLSTGILILP